MTHSVRGKLAVPGVWLVEIDQPPVNALRVPELIAIAEEVRRAHHSEQVVILSGQPGHFSAGLDLDVALALDVKGVQELWAALFDSLRAIVECRRPVVAAVTGHAPAFGAVLASVCDQRFMARGPYKIGFNGVLLGLPPFPGVHEALVHLVGPRQAERLETGGELLTPDDAVRLGLVDELVDPTRVVDRAVAWAQNFLSQPPSATERARSLNRKPIRAAFATVSAKTLNEYVDIWHSKEAQAALHARLKQLRRTDGSGT